MKTLIDHDGLKEIDADFERLQQNNNIMKDGAICMDRYSSANLRVMWVLKQNIDYGFSNYSTQILQNLDKVSSSPTWRRIAHASHGFLSGLRDFQDVKKQVKGDCLESMLSTAIVNVNKELGGSRSSDRSVLEGYSKYRDIVQKQIVAHAPDVIIACMTGSGESLKPVVESIYKDFTCECEYRINGNSNPKSANVAWSALGKKMLLWAYHPSYTRVSDSDYFDGIMNAYDEILNQ